MSKEIYERLAEVYDQGGWAEYSQRLFPYLQEVLRRYRFRKKRMADLACGTGTLALSMSQKGYQVVGVDRSAAMLREARKKARQEKISVTFLKQDIRELRLVEPVDLVTCFFDSINYLLSYGDLVKAFASVAQALHRGGLFIFDINTAAGLAAHWDHHRGGRDLGDVAIIGTNSFDPRKKLGTIRITVFKKIKSKGVESLYERFSEVHTERAYATREVKSALVDGGLKLSASYDCMTFRRPNKATGRILYVAERA
ncbi:class I SAM-dependent DNA methyltransferase [Candidatus Zixiibacteriota bacterium]